MKFTQRKDISLILVKKIVRRECKILSGLNFDYK